MTNREMATGGHAESGIGRRPYQAPRVVRLAAYSRGLGICESGSSDVYCYTGNTASGSCLPGTAGRSCFGPGIGDSY